MARSKSAAAVKSAVVAAPPKQLTPEEMLALRITMIERSTRFAVEAVARHEKNFLNADGALRQGADLLSAIQWNTRDLANAVGQRNVCTQVADMFTYGAEHEMSPEQVLVEIVKQANRAIDRVTRHGGFIHESTSAVSNTIDNYTMKGELVMWHEMRDICTMSLIA